MNQPEPLRTIDTRLLGPGVEAFAAELSGALREWGTRLDYEAQFSFAKRVRSALPV